jgi:esterase/lipase superfamily enzyme
MNHVRIGNPGSPPDAWRRFAFGVLILIPCCAFAQSDPLFQAYQNYETAKAAKQVPEALKYGDVAVQLTESQGGKQDLVQLLRGLGDFAGQSGEDQVALRYYSRALSLQESDLGADHPDLVPVLSAMADLYVKAKRYPEAAATLQRILKIERAAYGDHHDNVSATLIKLRGVYSTANDADGLARTDELIRSIPSSKRQMSGVKGGIAVNPKRYAMNGGFASVRVYYGTNRAVTGETKPALRYGTASGPLQYGFLDVTIPQSHQLAELETPKQWSEYTLRVENADAKKQFVLLGDVQPLSKEDFVAHLQGEIGASPSKDVFIFVHGYNNSFEDTARRTAQLAYDMAFDGTPIMYSWPSQASLTGYAADEDMIDVSGKTLSEFLGTVANQSGAARIHLIAHSMGNRVLLAALKSYMPNRKTDKRPHAFGQVVFTAPDVDRSAFIAAFQGLRGGADRITLYASSTDVALRMSQLYHWDARAGYAGPQIIRLPGLDTIDMSGLPADILGHSYFAANGGAVYDLLHLLWRGDAPNSPQRCSTGEVNHASAAVVWRFEVSKCEGAELLEAAMLLKEYGDLASAQVLDRVSAQIAALSEPAQKRAAELVMQRLKYLLASGAGPAG